MKKITIIGNICADATVRTTNGSTAINFNVAVNESYKDSEGVKQERTDFYSSPIWRTGIQSTEVAKYLKKGTQVYVEGNPTNSIYKNRDGQPVIDQQIRVLEVKLLGSPKEKAESQTTTTTTTEPENLPF